MTALRSATPRLALQQRIVLVAGVVLTLAALSWSGCVQETPSSVQQTVSTLIGLLHDASPAMRRTAVESLGKIGDPATALAVIPLIDDPNPMVRNAAAKAAGRTGSGTIPEVVPHLIRALEDTEAEVRLAAAEALGELEPPLEFLGPLVSLLSSHRREVRRAASYALIPLDLSSRSKQLAGAMHDPDPDVRQAIVAVLGEADAKEAALRIREVALHDPQPAVRIEAIYRLRHLDDEETRLVLKRIAETDRAEEVRRWARSEKGSRHGID